MITTKLKSIVTFNINATTSASITLSFTGIGLIAIPISFATACGLSVGNKVKNDFLCVSIANTKNNNKKVNKQLNLKIT